MFGPSPAQVRTQQLQIQARNSQLQKQQIVEQQKAKNATLSKYSIGVQIPSRIY